jgi:hypothetical protein
MSYLRQLLALGVLAAVGFALFLGAFAIGAGSSVTILFYRGLVVAAAVGLVTGVVGALVGRRFGDPSLAISAAAVSFSLNVCFLVLLPVTVDRSVTVYLLSTIEGQQGGTTAPALEQAFVSGYVRDMHAIGRRIDEQRRSGNVSVGTDGKVRLTVQGRRFMGFSRSVARLFGTDPRFVHAAASRR